MAFLFSTDLLLLLLLALYKDRLFLYCVVNENSACSVGRMLVMIIIYLMLCSAIFFGSVKSYQGQSFPPSELFIINNNTICCYY